MSFERLPAVEGSIACLTCGSGAKSDLSMERMIAVGFGDAGYTKDGLGVWSESDAAADSEDDFPVVADVEKLAAADPDHDWRIYVRRTGPLPSEGLLHAPDAAAAHPLRWMRRCLR